MVRILRSTLKHGVEPEELAYAIVLEQDYIEVFADTAANGEAVIFHAMTAQDPWRI